METAAVTVESPDRPSRAGGLQVESISDYPSLLALESAWDALVEEAGIEHPFLTHEWVCSWWESFGAGNELFVLKVTAGGKLVGIAPLMLSSEKIYGFKVRRLGFICNDHTPRCGFITSDRSGATYQAIWKYLVDQGGRWDLIELSQMPAGAEILEVLPRLAEQGGFPNGLQLSTESPYVSLSGTWDAYFKGLKKKHRNNTRNRLHRFEKLGPLKLEEVGGDEFLEEALEEGLRIEAAAWKAQAGTAILSGSDVCPFYRALAGRARRRGWLRLYFLTVNGRRVAFAYCLLYRNRLYALKSGYDPEYYSYSPFNMLIYTMLQNGYERGMDEFDFLGEKEAWKLDWTQETRSHHSLVLFGRGWRPRLLRFIKFRLLPRMQRLPMYPWLLKTVIRLQVFEGTGRMHCLVCVWCSRNCIGSARAADACEHQRAAGQGKGNGEKVA